MQPTREDIANSAQEDQRWLCVVRSLVCSFLGFRLLLGQCASLGDLLPPGLRCAAVYVTICCSRVCASLVCTCRVVCVGGSVVVPIFLHLAEATVRARVYVRANVNVVACCFRSFLFPFSFWSLHWSPSTLVLLFRRVCWATLHLHLSVSLSSASSPQSSVSPPPPPLLPPFASVAVISHSLSVAGRCSCCRCMWYSSGACVGRAHFSVCLFLLLVRLLLSFFHRFPFLPFPRCFDVVVVSQE